MASRTSGVDTINTDIEKSIRSSGFYKKYQADLSALALPDPLPTTTIPKDPEQVKTNTVPVKREKVTSSELLDFMTENYEKFSDLKEVSDRCPNLGRTKGEFAEFCKTKLNDNAAFLTQLSQMFSEVRGEKTDVDKIVQSLQCLPPNVSEFKDLEEILKSMGVDSDCYQVKEIGDVKLFKKGSGQKSYTSGNYLLKKSGENSYEATVNLDFIQSGGSITPGEMMSKVRSCLSTVNKYLLGPGGAKLTIRALSPSETASLPSSERPLPGKIKISSDDSEMNSETFTGSIQCPTIAHELMHHLGLCDEYLEERTNIIPPMKRSRAEEWSCRNVVEGTSLMKNDIQAYNDVVPQKISCSCANESCRKTLQGVDSRSPANQKILMTARIHSILGMKLSAYCQTGDYTTGLTLPEPEKAYRNVKAVGDVLTFEHRLAFETSGGSLTTGARNITCKCSPEDQNCPAEFAAAAKRMSENPVTPDCPWNTAQDGDKTIANDGDSSTISGNSIILVSTPVKKSLISPNHFDKILTGDCMGGPSLIYKQCAEFAYVPKDSPACKNKPSECSDDKKFLGVQPQ